MNDKDVIKQNKVAWDRRVADGSEWTVCVSSKVIELAQKGVFNIKLTAQKPVPQDWFPIAHNIPQFIEHVGDLQRPLEHCVFFKETKQHLKLGTCQSRDFDAQRLSGN